MSQRNPSQYSFNEAQLQASIRKLEHEMDCSAMQKLLSSMKSRTALASFDFAGKLPLIYEFISNLQLEEKDNAMRCLQAALHTLSSKCSRLMKESKSDMTKHVFDMSTVQIRENFASNKRADCYLVIDPKLQKQYVVKKLKASFDSQESQATILKNLSIFSKLSHSAVLPFCGFTFYFNTKRLTAPAYVTKFMKNQNLESHWAKQRSLGQVSSSTQRMIFLIGMASGIRYLHRQGIVHRNLRPCNVLLNSKHEPKLADFLDLPQSASEAVAYLAPEVLASKEYSDKSDIYSFGVIAYQIVTNKVPYECDPRSIPSFVGSGGRPSFTAGVPPELVELISECWEQNPEKRITASKLVSELLALEVYDDVDWETLSTYVKKVLPGHHLKGYAKGSSRATSIRSDDPSEVMPLEFLIDCARNGSAKAQVDYGRMLQLGDEVPKDDEEAVRLYELATKQGYADGQYWFANCLYYGIGVSQDYAKAYEYFRKAADQGHKEAQYYTGMCLKDGTGVLMDLQEARKFFNMAAQQGDVSSMRHLRTLQ